MKLKAFSIIEILISIIISAIVIGTSYSVFVFTQKGFFKFSNVKAEVRNYFELSTVMRRDIEKAKKVYQVNSSEIELEMTDKTIQYEFYDAFILRSYDQQLDTFFVAVDQVVFNQGNDLLIPTLIDFVQLKMNDDGGEKELTLYKDYGAIVKIENYGN